MKYQVLFSLKNNEKVFINVVCCAFRVNLACKVFYPELQKLPITRTIFGGFDV